MKWEVKIDGKPVEQTFETEDAACQYAANIRGQNWSMKIDVRDLDAPAMPEPKPAPAPESFVVGTVDALTKLTPSRK